MLVVCESNYLKTAWGSFDKKCLIHSTHRSSSGNKMNISALKDKTNMPVCLSYCFIHMSERPNGLHMNINRVRFDTLCS